ncbi:MAG: response regulator [Gemmatimonadota bacterium]|nr:response regulator [Gemmatimonadota bacterium]
MFPSRFAVALSERQVPSRGRILVADDEPHIRRILTTLFESADFAVDAVEDGRAACERLEGSTPYVMAVMDIMMPEATGLEVLASLKGLRHREELPVVILTAKGQDADRTAALEGGARAFLTKPFSPKKLLARVDQIMIEAS